MSELGKMIESWSLKKAVTPLTEMDSDYAFLCAGIVYSCSNLPSCVLSDNNLEDLEN